MPLVGTVFARLCLILILTLAGGLGCRVFERNVPAPAAAHLLPGQTADVFTTARPTFAAALNDFLRLDSGIERWHDANFEPTLRAFQERFEATNTEEGSVMATTLAYVITDLRTSRRAAILEEFRTSTKILDLFKQGVEELGGTNRGL